MRTIILAVAILAAAAILLRCDTGKGECSGPTIHGCSGSICTYLYIYDENGNFISEGAGSPRVYWNGTDCRGNKVPCGKYIVESHIVAYGSQQTTTEEILVVDSTGTTRYGRSACDSLKAECSGHYAETNTSYIDGGSISSGIGCTCCE